MQLAVLYVAVLLGVRLFISRVLKEKYDRSAANPRQPDSPVPPVPE
jgi:hypothetical protein